MTGRTGSPESERRREQELKEFQTQQRRQASEREAVKAHREAQRVQKEVDVRVRGEKERKKEERIASSAAALSRKAQERKKSSGK